MPAFFISFGLIFFAELGDKSQLVALWFATRHRWWLVILGVAVATLVVHLGSTAIGASAADLLPEAGVLFIVGLSFYAFGLWSLRGDTFEEREEAASRSMLGALGAVTAGFFLAELGDKTQLATISLAGQEEGFVAVWIGSTLGMVAADALAIGAGVVAGKRLPQRTLAMVSAALFAGFGTVAIARAAVLMVD